ncbi:efflux RND transporter periplasmic adaptor subunit [Maritimibacter dapengensis]|uniref:Efflux RND transporter periplasmic adaptor subunit n=1 Tax=Maritimibacter dapengensis TaxID=2836868 RepID=A0ABS6T114_9RHOB|nr:efflux RND transporter periplasmic adaptor subunit [Maritimibacter dapengensis]MBV7378923.1 efflux RND transporter periplasmic adaptor subunit [Maritimibacter dapengensis]
MNMENPKPDWAMNKREKARAEMIARGEEPKKRRKWPWFVLFMAVLVAGGGYYYTEVYQPSQMAAAPAPVVEAPRESIVQLAPYEVETIAPMLLEDTLRMTGSLTPARQVHLSAEVSARLLEVSVREGDSVNEGDVLARFDIDNLENQLAQAMSNAQATRVQVQQAQSDFTRTETLVDRELAAPTALENARTGLQQLQAQLAAQETAVENAQAALDKASVSAPFDGVISERQADAGEFVATGSPLFTIVDLSAFEVEATAPVSKSPMIQTGQRVELTVEGFGDRAFAGMVERINPVAIAGSRALPVYIALENSDGLLRGGMFASGFIKLDEKEGALSVPVEAVREDAEGNYVLKIDGETLVRQSVETTRDWENGARVEVATGLSEGDTIVAAALPELRAGQKIALIGE